MKALGIIPARYASTRLPGKPLQLLHGKPLIQRVYENACRAKRIERLLVATDDQRIYETVEKFGGEAFLTPSDLNSGTDRCAWVARQLDYPLIANIQGDEPFLAPQVIDDAIADLEANPTAGMATAARRGITQEELQNPNVVKVLIDRQGNALYFSRQNIPYIRDSEDLPTKHPALVHYGLYIYRRDFLLKLTTLPLTDLERLEKLEQLRALEHGFSIRVVVTDQPSFGIDTWEDLQKAVRLIEEYETNHRD